MCNIDWAIVSAVLSVIATVFSGVATFLLAIITYRQIYLDNRAKISVASEFDELFNRYYLVMSNTGKSDCVILDVKYTDSTEKLLRTNDVLPANWKTDKYLPFQGFRGSSFSSGSCKFCELKPQKLFVNGDSSAVIEVTVVYRYRSVIRHKTCEDKFSICMSEYLSTRMSFPKSSELTVALDNLTRAIDLSIMRSDGGINPC